MYLSCDALSAFQVLSAHPVPDDLLCNSLRDDKACINLQVSHYYSNFSDDRNFRYRHLYFLLGLFSVSPISGRLYVMTPSDRYVGNR
jgi:hypothetical protein